MKKQRESVANVGSEPKGNDHTPTPWKIGTRPIEISGTFFEVIGGNGVPTPFLQERIDEDLSSRIAIKNHNEDAAFIVQAVNAHEELLKALKYVVKGLKAQNLHVPSDIDSIIAKAEGR